MQVETNSLRALVERANRLALEVYGFSNSCIATSAALRDVLMHYGVPAELLRVQAIVYPADSMLGHACALGHNGDGTRRPRSQNWHGHLVVIADGQFLLDATLDQVNDSQPHLKAEPMVITVSQEFLRGEISHSEPTGTAGAIVRYRAFPGRGGYKSAPAFRLSQRRELIDRLLEHVPYAA